MSPPSRSEKEPAPASPVPRGGFIAMGSILAAMALLAIYSNVQKARRHEVEAVIVTPAGSPALSPSPAP